jgi:hypothetical protein
MTPAPQEYIITEDELGNIEALLKRNAFFQSVIDEHLDSVWNRPNNPNNTSVSKGVLKLLERIKRESEMMACEISLTEREKHYENVVAFLGELHQKTKGCKKR